jgi:hypothetical protein
MHPHEIVLGIAKRIVVLSKDSLPTSYTIVLNEGTAFYSGRLLEKGALVCRNSFEEARFACEGEVSLFGLPFHEYFTLVSQYLTTQLPVFTRFISSIQIFSIFSAHTMEKIASSLTLSFLMKGEFLCMSGDNTTDLYLIYSGSAVRKIIVEVDRTNKIPLQHFNKLVKVFSRSYEHRIKFEAKDLVGIADLIEGVTIRRESVVVEENAMVLAIDRNAVEDSLDEYVVDRLKKYNVRKYLRDDAQLCENYLRQKL